MKKDLIEQLEEAWYKFYKKHVLYENSKWFYQKKVWDYHINCIIYYDSFKDWDVYEFNVQFTKDDRSIDIWTVHWFWYEEEEYRKYPTLQEVEEMFNKLYKAYE